MPNNEIQPTANASADLGVILPKGDSKMDVNDKIENFTKLLEEFKEIPRINEPEPTIMEISGYPHYEIVIT